MTDYQREHQWTDGEHKYRVQVCLDGQEFRGAVQRQGPHGIDSQTVGPMVMENLKTLSRLQESIRVKPKPPSRKHQRTDGEHKYRVGAICLDGQEFRGAVQRQGSHGIDSQTVGPMVMENLKTLIGLQESISRQLRGDLDRLSMDYIDHQQLERIKRDRAQPYDLGDLEPIRRPEPSETEPLTHLRHRTEHGTGAYCGASPASERHLLQPTNLISVAIYEDVPVCDLCGREAAHLHPAHVRAVQGAYRRRTDDLLDLSRHLELPFEVPETPNWYALTQ